MIVDTHTHVWQSPEQLGAEVAAALRVRAAAAAEEYDASPGAHEQATEVAAVAFVIGQRSAHLGLAVPNDLVGRYVGGRPDRLVGFAGIDPLEAGFEDELARLGSLRIAGVAVSPAEQNFHPMHSRAVRLYEHCAEQRLPLIVHTPDVAAPSIALQYAQPMLVDEVARAFPTLRILLTGAGYPFTEQTLALVAKHAHVYTEISTLIPRTWQLFTFLLSAHEMGVTERVLFGSGFPHESPASAVERVYSINRFAGAGAEHLPTIPREKLRAIVERDAVASLGLKLPASTRAAVGDGPARRPAQRPAGQMLGDASA